MGYRTALNSPATSSAPARGRGTARMSAGGAFTALIGIQTAAIGVTAALTELEGPAANVGQGLTSMLNGLMSAGFILMAFTGPIGIASASIIALVSVTDGLFKIFNDGKGILQTFMSDMSDLNKQIKINKSLTETLAAGDLRQFATQFNLQMLGESIAKTEGVTEKTGLQMAMGITKGFNVPGLNELQADPRFSRVAVRAGEVDDEKLGLLQSLGIMMGGYDPTGMSTIARKEAAVAKTNVIKTVTEEDLQPFLDVVEALPSIDAIFEQYATADIRADEYASQEFRSKITREVNQILADGLTEASEAFATDGISDFEKATIQSNMLEGVSKLADDLAGPGFGPPQEVIADLTIFEQIMKGARESMAEMRTDSELIFENLGRSLPRQLSDGLADAFDKAIDGSESLGESLRNIANEFLETIQRAFLQRAADQTTDFLFDAVGDFFKNSGGIVPKRYYGGGSVGSGTDTVPAMLTGGEFVMKKGAVEKYGTPFMEQLNAGAIDSTSSVAGGVSNSINVAFNITGGEGGTETKVESGTSDSQNSMIRRMKQAVTTIVAEESRPGGALYKTGR